MAKEDKKDDVAETRVDAKVVNQKAVEQDVFETERKIREQAKTQPHVKIRIPSDRRGGGMAPVEVGLNGTGYLIKRDEDVIVPEGVYNVLMEAKESIYEVYDEYGQKKMRFREAQRHPVVFLGYVDPKTGRPSNEIRK